jgi:hypothetical protein
VASGSAAPLAVSPDGHRVAFVARSADDKYLLWVRSMDTLTAQPLGETDGASSPFWSPDGSYVGFFAGGKLKKIEVSGGPPITLCDATDNIGGTWSRDGVIVFAPRNPSTLQKVSAAGGVSTAATVLGHGEALHGRPFFLSDGRHFLYRAFGSPGGIYVGSLDSAERKWLLNADSTNVLYTQDHLLFLRETTLMAQPFAHLSEKLSAVKTRLPTKVRFRRALSEDTNRFGKAWFPRSRSRRPPVDLFVALPFSRHGFPSS